MQETKLTPEAVAEIRRLWANEEWGYKRLARHFGINENTARDIVLGRLWNEDGAWPRKPYSTIEKDIRMQGPGRYWRRES